MTFSWELYINRINLVNKFVSGSTQNELHQNLYCVCNKFKLGYTTPLAGYSIALTAVHQPFKSVDTISEPNGQAFLRCCLSQAGL